MTLHKSSDKNSKLDTTLAYQVCYYPWSKLPGSAQRYVAWQKSSVLSKKELLEDCNEDQTEIMFIKDQTWFTIHWEYNNIPTEQQWKDLDDDALLRVQFRISSFCGGSGRVAILSLLWVNKKDLRNVEHT